MKSRMSATSSRKPQLSSRLPLPRSNAVLLILGISAMALSGWSFAVLALRWPRHLAAPTFAVVLLLGPSTLILSAWEMLRYRVTWRALLAALLSALATALWVCMVFEIIHH